MGVDGAGKAGGKGKAGGSHGADRPAWAREVWRMAFGADASKLSLKTVGDLKTLPKAVRDFAHSAAKMTEALGGAAPIEVQQGTWKGETFYKVSDGGQNMLIDSRGRDFLSMMQAARPAAPAAEAAPAAGWGSETMRAPPKGWVPH